MRAEQDWCLQCGTGAPGSLPARSRGLRSAAAVLAALAVLVAGAAAAAYAALSKSSAKPRAVSTLASTPPSSASPPPAATPPPAASAAPPPRIPKLGPPAALKPRVPLVKPTKPLQVPSGVKSPATSTSPSAPAPATTPAPSGTKTQAGKGTPAPAAKPPTPIVLDTNAASTYNPYGYPASNFGDPTLAVDGDAATAWTALVDPGVAPQMAEGLLIDLKSAQRLSALALTSSTPGMTVQVYGAAASPAPASITDPAWVRLSSPLVANKAKERIALAQPKRSFRLVTLWISNAPSSAVGTPQSPGHVRVNEIELFAAS